MTKNILKYVMILSAFLFTLTSCRNDDDATNDIKIEIHEVGEHDTHGGNTVAIGEELHLDVEIEAPNKIENIYVEVAQKSNANNKIISQNFTENKGEKNVDFHKHIDIPTTATAGDYVVSVTVTDQKGFSKIESANLKITAAE